MLQPLRLFLSAATTEFEEHRDLVAEFLVRSGRHATVQKGFGVGGSTTLDKLDEYVRRCDAVIHLVGRTTGDVPTDDEIIALLAAYPGLSVTFLPGRGPADPLPAFSYTQWEAYLALHHKRRLFVYHPKAWDPLDPTPTADAREQAQRAHFGRIIARGRDRGTFETAEGLSAAVLADLTHFLPPPADPYPFRPIADTLRDGRGDVREFVPSRDEYEQGQVGRPALAGRVEEKLDRAGWALVRGHGAAGKTVLATLIALGYARADRPAYYLDLTAADPDVARVIDGVTRLARPDGLLVIDNVHLGEDVALRAYQSWRAAGSGSHLLLLGRLTREGTNAYGAPPQLSDLDREALILEVGEDDLTGVVNRLVRRADPKRAGSLDPPAGVRPRWLRLFKGDLIAFSAAAAARLPNILRGDWELQPEDAKAYVRKKYLQGTTDTGRAARAALLDVARGSAIELATPDTVVDRDLLADYIRAGVIFVAEPGWARSAYFTLAHPGLATLLLSAADPRDCSSFEDLAARNPLFGFNLVRRLAALPAQADRGAQVLKSLAADPGPFLVGLVGNHVDAIRPNLALVTRTGLLSPTEVDALLVSPPSGLIPGAVQAMPDKLVAFLRFAEGALPAAHAAVVAALADSANHPALVASALRASPDKIAAFLRYAVKAVPAANAAVAAALADPANHPALVAFALRASPDHLVAFLRYVAKAVPAAHAAVAAALADPANHPALVASALACSLDHMAAFLQEPDGVLREVHAAVATALAEPANHPALVASALGCSLDQVAAFLRYAAAAIPAANAAVAAALADPANHPALVASALRAQPDQLSAFLRYAAGVLPGLHAAVAAALADPANRPALVEFTFRGSPDTWAAFLRYAESSGSGRAVAAAVAGVLTDPANHPALVATASAAPPDKLAAGLRYSKLALPTVYAALIAHLTDPAAGPPAARQTLPAVNPALAALALKVTTGPPPCPLAFQDFPEVAAALVAAIDRPAWEAEYARRTIADAAFIARLAQFFERFGRPDLAAAPALAILRSARPQIWRGPAAGIAGLAVILRHGRHLGAAVLDRYLDEVIGAQWLGEQYKDCPTGALAEVLFGVWRSQAESTAAKFCRPGLGRRVETEVWRALDAGGPAAGEVIQLVGTVALLGGPSVRNPHDLPDEREMGVILGACAAAFSAEFTPVEARFWLGMRELAQVHEEVLLAPPDVLARARDRWRTAAATSPRDVAFNAWMLDWLGRCAAGGGALFPDDLPLAAQWTGKLPPTGV